MFGLPAPATRGLHTRQPVTHGMCNYRLVWFALLILVGMAHAPAPSAASDIAADAASAARLRAHQLAVAAHTSIQADVITVTHAPLGRTIGRVVARGPWAYYRVEQDLGDRARVLQESAVTPTELLTLNYEAGVATRVDLARVQHANPQVSIPNSARDLLDTFARAAPGSVQYLGPIAHEGATLDRFRIVAALGDGPAGTLLVWVAPADGLPRRVELHSPKGRLLLERRFVNVKVNAPVPDAVFTLQVPSDMAVHDVTDEYLTGGADVKAESPQP